MAEARMAGHERVATNKKELESLLRDSEGSDLGFLVGDRSALRAHQGKTPGNHDRQRHDYKYRGRNRKPAAFGIVQHIVTPLRLVYAVLEVHRGCEWRSFVCYLTWSNVFTDTIEMELEYAHIRQV